MEELFLEREKGFQRGIYPYFRGVLRNRIRNREDSIHFNTALLIMGDLVHTHSPTQRLGELAHEVEPALQNTR